MSAPRRGPVPGFGGRQPGAGRPRAIPVGAEVALGLLIPLLPEPLRAGPPPGWARRLLGTSRQRAAYLAAGRCALATLEAAIGARPVVDWPELATSPESVTKNREKQRERDAGRLGRPPGGKPGRRALPIPEASELAALTVADAAALYGVSRVTVCAWRRARGIRAYVRGKVDDKLSS